MALNGLFRRQYGYLGTVVGKLKSFRTQSRAERAARSSANKLAECVVCYQNKTHGGHHVINLDFHLKSHQAGNDYRPFPIKLVPDTSDK